MKEGKFKEQEHLGRRGKSFSCFGEKSKFTISAQQLLWFFRWQDIFRYANFLKQRWWRVESKFEGCRLFVEIAWSLILYSWIFQHMVPSSLWACFWLWKMFQYWKRQNFQYFHRMINVKMMLVHEKDLIVHVEDLLCRDYINGSPIVFASSSLKICHVNDL